MNDELIDITFFEQAEQDLICWYWNQIFVWIELFTISDNFQLLTDYEINHAQFIIRSQIKCLN